MQTCAEVQALIARTRSLFGSGGAVEVPTGASSITRAAHSVVAARARTADLSGTGVASYQGMADRAVPPLSTAAVSDTAVTAHLSTAAAVMQAGAARLDQIATRTRVVTAAAPAARSAADQRIILTALRSQVVEAGRVTQSTQQQAGALAGQIRGLQYPKDAPAQALGHDVPLSPAPSTDPPHGQDPRYWIDVTKIIRVPDGQLAPQGTIQIGPGLYYPYSDQSYNVTPPPPPAKYPLDINDITRVGPGQLGPSGTTELVPGVFAPTPNPYQPEAPWAPPQRPIDIRDIVHVPAGELAPWGYREYLPGWWVPDPAASGPR